MFHVLQSFADTLKADGSSLIGDRRPDAAYTCKKNPVFCPACPAPHMLALFGTTTATALYPYPPPLRPSAPATDWRCVCFGQTLISDRPSNEENRASSVSHTFPDEVLIEGGRSRVRVAQFLFGSGPMTNSKIPPATISLC